MSEVEKIAKQMVSKGKGILAADESTGTMSKRLSGVNVESTAANRLKFRETLFSAEGMKNNIGGCDARYGTGSNDTMTVYFNTKSDYDYHRASWK